MSLSRLLALPGFDQRSHESLLRLVDGRIKVLSLFLDVQVAVLGQLNQHVATISSVTLAHMELNLDPVELVWIRVLLDGADDVLLNVLANGVGEVEMSGSEIEMHV